MPRGLQPVIRSNETLQLRKKISERNEVVGIHFDQYVPKRPTQEISEIGVPTLLKMLLAYFIVKADKLLHEGLFRKNADSETLS